MAQEVKAWKAPRTTRVSSKNQVTLPVAVLAASRIGAGDDVRVESAGDGRIMIVREHDPIEEIIGAAPGLTGATDLQALRDEWRR